MRVEIPADRPRAEVPLSRGGTVVLAPLSPVDRHYLVEGLEELSIDSRFARFGQGRDRLSESEWDYLSDVDQRDHVAWAAVIDDLGVGVGRYIRVDESSAEVAVTVLDEHQGLGVGTALFEALVAVARADGIAELRFEVLPSNTRVLGALTLLGAGVVDADGLLEGRLAIEQAAVGENEEELVEVMESFRRGA